MDPRLSESFLLKVFSGIPVTAENERIYESWCVLCRRQRALFHLIDQRRANLALAILQIGLSLDR